MFRLMTKHFAGWAAKSGIPLADLAASLNEIEQGLVDADLGGNLFKKRVRLQGRGKRGGARVILCCKWDDRAIFLHGYSKNEKSDLAPKELAILRRTAESLLQLDAEQLNRAIAQGIFIEVG